MSVRERCSCSAEFESDEPEAVKLLKEWRSKHRCIVTPELRDVSMGAQVENAIGFQIDGLQAPVRQEHWDTPDETERFR